MFEKFIIDEKNMFNNLSNATKFENVMNGRKGAVVVENKNNLIPIVRTTTKYQLPVQSFEPIHYDIINKIKQVVKRDLEFNNALIEIYDNNYKTMSFHSDQSLDLANDSYICIFSCYDEPTFLRKLVIKDKITNSEIEICLENNSIVLFDISTNYKHLHKIILDSGISNNKWLGITFRLSKTYIKFINEIPYFHNTNKILKLADEHETKEFYKLRGNENRSIEYTYPEINYTISVSDLMNIKQ
jgi:hypothetical protein